MKKIILFLVVTAAATTTNAQKYFTKNATVIFDAGTALEDVSAINKSGTSVSDAATGQFEFAVLIKGFEFKKALMQEHFNENYMESSRFQKSVFKGKITNLAAVNLQKPGTYPVTATGELEIHGVKRTVTCNGTLKTTGQGVQIAAKFNVVLSDYKIAIPGIVKDKIASVAKVSVSGSYAILN